MRDGGTVVLTRAPEDNAGLARDLRASGVTVLEIPSASIEPLADHSSLAAAIRGLTDGDWLVFTSRAGVDAARRCVDRDGVTTPVAAIGGATARRCAEWGITAWVPSAPNGAALGRELPLRDGVVLLARADRADRAIVDELLRRGARVREVVAYHVVPNARGDVVAARRAALAGGAVIVASPAAATGFASAVGAAAFGCARILAIGATTARAATELGGNVRVLDELTAEAVVRELEVRHVAHR